MLRPTTIKDEYNRYSTSIDSTTTAVTIQLSQSTRISKVSGSKKEGNKKPKNETKKYLDNSQKCIPGWIEITTTAGLEPATEKVCAKHDEEEDKERKDQQERGDRADGVEEAPYQPAEWIPIPVCGSEAEKRARPQGKSCKSCFY